MPYPLSETVRFDGYLTLEETSEVRNPELDQFWLIDYRLYDPQGDGKSKLDHVVESRWTHPPTNPNRWQAWADTTVNRAVKS